MMSEVDDADPVAAAAAANGTTAATTASALTPTLSLAPQHQHQQQQQQSRQQWTTTTAQTIMLGRDGEDRVTTNNTRKSPDWRTEKKSMEHHHRRHSSSSAASSSTTTASWWDRTFRKNKNNSYDEEDNDDDIAQASSAASTLENGSEHEHYAPLEEEGEGSRSNGRVRPPLHKKKQMSQMKTKRSLLEEPNGRGHGDDGDEFSASNNRMLTAEDVLERDCSFFYRQEEDHPVVSIGLQQQQHGRDNKQQRRHRFRTLLRQQDDPYHPRHAFLYQDAVDVQSPSVLQDYKMRYKQLNQAELFLDHDTTSAEDPFDEDVVVADDGDTNNNPLTRMMPLLSHSLQLDENDTTGSTTSKTMTPRTASSSSSSSDGSNSIVRSDTAFHSSLCYLHHGRLLMRLPNDQVRLVMDPDLEAGILSVEQWRRPPSSPTSKQIIGSTPQDPMATTAGEEPNEELPPLRYVLTVPMDLYQKLVQEMGHGITSRSSSSSSSSASSSVCAALCSACCNCNIHYEHGNERMDIRIAVWVLATVLILMFINTVIWGAGQ